MDSIDVYPNKMIRDSASALFNLAGLTVRDKAMAAFVIGNTYFQMKNRTTGCDWVRRASTIDSSRAMFSTFIADQCS